MDPILLLIVNAILAVGVANFPNRIVTRVYLRLTHACKTDPDVSFGVTCSIMLGTTFGALACMAATGFGYKMGLPVLIMLAPACGMLGVGLIIADSLLRRVGGAVGRLVTNCDSAADRIAESIAAVKRSNRPR